MAEIAKKERLDMILFSTALSPMKQTASNVQNWWHNLLKQQVMVG
jgi:hypothetical protein